MDVDIGKGKIDATVIDVLAPWRQKNLTEPWAVIQTLVCKKKKKKSTMEMEKRKIQFQFSSHRKSGLLEWVSKVRNISKIGDTSRPL